MVARPQENAIGRLDREWAIGGKHVVTPDGVREAVVLVRGEKIVDVVAPASVPPHCPLEDVGDRVILPGLVDAHVHINEPGRTEWEGFATATRAAAAGGVTTLVDMPLNSSPVTTTVDALATKLAAAEGKLWVDCGFYAGVVAGSSEHIEPLVAAGVLGFKAFLCPSGIDDFPAATESDLRAAMPRIASAGLPLLVHAELIGPEQPAAAESLAAEPRSYATYLASRPRQWEHQAIELMLHLCREYGCRVHIVHLSSADALPLLDRARAARLPVTVETCPHYLFFAAEEIPDGDTRFKCAPPIRERENLIRLKTALREGRIDYLASDHSPAPPTLKHLDTGNFERAWGGIASLQLMLPIVWTMLRQWPGVGLTDLAQWLSSRPARLVGLDRRKGALAAGYDADLVVFDPDALFTVSSEMLHHRHKITPYDGRRLQGRVDKTVLRGQTVYDAGNFPGTPSGLALLGGGATAHFPFAHSPRPSL
jgi:allantoinase